MSQNPPNPNWQGGPQGGPGQPWQQGGPQQPQQPQPGGPQGQQPSFGQYHGAQPTPQRPTGPQPPYGNGPQQQYGGPQQGHPQGNAQVGGTPVDPKKKSKAPAIIAGVLALALIAGGVFLGMRFFGGATPAAVKALPANALGAVEINLEPAANQQLAVRDWVERFPSLQAEAPQTDDYKQALWEMVTSQEEDAPDYETEIKPWLGASIAMAVVEGTDGEPQPVIAVETTDEGKAREFFTSEAPDMEVEFIDKTAVLWEADDVSVDVNAIEGAALADTDSFKADMDKLGSDAFLATFWVGPEGMQKVAESGDVTATGFNVDDLADMRVAGGLKVESDVMGMEFVSYSPEAQAGGDDVDAKDFAASMDGDALAVLGFGLNDDQYAQMWEGAQPLLEQDPAMSELITSVDDLKALFGNRAAVSVSLDNLQAPEPKIGIKTETKDVDRQQEILDRFFGGQEVPGLERSTEGDVTVFGFGQTTDAVLNPASKLGDNDAFATATDGAGPAILWVNTDKIRSFPEFSDAPPELKEALEPIAGIGGGSSDVEDGYVEGFLRVIAQS